MLAKRATNTPNLQAVTGKEAILGGVRANWKGPTAAHRDLWDSDQFVLRDFKKLAEYLARNAAVNIPKVATGSAPTPAASAVP